MNEAVAVPLSVQPMREDAPAPIPEDSRRLAGRAVRGGVLLLAARLAVQLFTWTVTLTVARLLTPNDYGMMTTGVVFVVLADLLAEAGVGKALIHKETVEPADLAHAFTISFGLSMALFGILNAAAGPLGVFLEKPDFPLLLRVLSLLVLLIPLRTVPLALLERGLYMGRQAGLHVFSSVAQGSVVLGLASAGAGYWSLAAGVITARMLEVLTLLYVTRWRPRFLWPGPGGWALLAFGAHVSLGSMLWYTSSNCDFIIVGKLLGTTALGWYALAFQLISMPVQKLTANTNQIVYPVFCRLRHDPARLRDWYLRLTVLLGFLGMPALAGMALTADDAFALVLGERWARPCFRSSC